MQYLLNRLFQCHSEILYFWIEGKYESPTNIKAKEIKLVNRYYISFTCSPYQY